MGLFNIRFLVNFALLAIPIGVTLGILLGIDSHRQPTGQAPLYSPPASTGGSGSGSGGDSPKNNGVTKTQFCQNSFGITPKSKGQEYTRESIPFCSAVPVLPLFRRGRGISSVAIWRRSVVSCPPLAHLS